LNISFLNRNGYKVSYIAKLEKEEMNAIIAGLSDTNHKQEKAVNELMCCMAEMDTEGFNMVLKGCEMVWGIDITLTGVIVPFSQKIGLLHRKHQKNYEAHLLLVEQTLKQKIIAGIEGAGTRKLGQTALFFLCKKKSEYKLLCLQYELKMAGFTVIYISSPVVLSQLCTIAAATKPTYIITVTGGKNPQVDPESLLDYLNENLPQTVFLNLENKERLPFQDILDSSAENFNTEAKMQLSQQN
ncbi:MAG TPA: hypothetical protein VM884_01425, partial [Flavisolibacter sp.]|jgi:hypothetical protein|nr:hypothetical protein [Flavisolibacter sp.]